MEIGDLKKYSFFEYFYGMPRRGMCKLMACSIENDTLILHTGDSIYNPICMLNFNLSNVDITVEKLSERVDKIHITMKDCNQKEVIYAHKIEKLA